MENQDELATINKKVGSRLRTLRLQCKENLVDVANAMEISVSQLSRLERGEQQLTVIELMRFARHFAVPVTTFFLDSVPESVKVTRLAQRPKLVRNVTNGESVVQELLLRAKNVKMEPSFLYIPAYGDSGEPITHEGEEFLTVIEGELIVWIGEQRYRLTTGDTIYYLCSIPHRWQNPSAIPSKILAVSTPPSY
jgi:quercetin dioxygenase-like cupin family protein